MWARRKTGLDKPMSMADERLDRRQLSERAKRRHSHVAYPPSSEPGAREVSFFNHPSDCTALTRTKVDR